jgi:hypothetical protein
MRLLGYPAAKISILATYAGQTALIRDVLSHRCAKNPLFGMPKIVTTVDRYQGEQNDCEFVPPNKTIVFNANNPPRCDSLSYSHSHCRLPS